MCLIVLTVTQAGDIVNVMVTWITLSDRLGTFITLEQVHLGLSTYSANLAPYIAQ